MNTLLEQINSVGQTFITFALPMLVQSSVLILVLLFIDLLLRKRVRAVFRYGIWMLVLVKLLLPTSLSWPLSVGHFFGDKLAYVDVTKTTKEAEPETLKTAEVIVPKNADLPNIKTNVQSPVISTMPANTEQLSKQMVPASSEPPTVSVTPVSWQGVVFLVWLSAVAAMGLLLLQRVIFVRGLIAQAKSASCLMDDVLAGCRERMNVRCKVGLKVSPNATSPAVCGLFRPVILVPRNLAPSLGASSLRTVLLHELAHIKRGDLWMNLVQTILQVIYFYNPLLWLANAIIRRIREQAVDETVQVAMGEKAGQYPETLVNIAKLAFGRPALSLRLIGVVESKSALSARIKHILNRPIPKRAKLGILSLLAIIIIAALLLPMAMSTPGPPELVIKGIVKDAQTGEPIAGARVFDDGYGPTPNWDQIRPDERAEWGAITNSAGEYSFLTWPEHHCIKVEAPGYKAKRETLYDGHFTFNKKDEETFDFALEPEEVSESSEFKKTLPNGVTVELVGVCEHPSEGKQWWRPDGNLLEDRPYDKVNTHSGSRGRKYELAFRIVNIPDPAFGWTIKSDEITVRALSEVSKDGLNVPDIRSVVVGFTERSEKKDIGLGIAAGPWKNIGHHHTRGVTTTSDGIVFQRAVEDSEGNIVLNVIHNINQSEKSYRVMAIGKNGTEYKAHYSGAVSRPAQPSITEIVFKNLKLSDVDEFLFQTRPYVWVEFKNVSLRPGFKTDVQVGVEGAKWTRITTSGGKVSVVGSENGPSVTVRKVPNPEGTAYFKKFDQGYLLEIVSKSYGQDIREPVGRKSSGGGSGPNYIQKHIGFGIPFSAKRVDGFRKMRQFRGELRKTITEDINETLGIKNAGGGGSGDLLNIRYRDQSIIGTINIFFSEKDGDILQINFVIQEVVTEDNKTDVRVKAEKEPSSSVWRKVTDVNLPFTFTIYTLTPDDKPQPGVTIRCVHPRPERANPIVDMIQQSDENGVATFNITKADLRTDWIYWFSLEDNDYKGTPEVGITPDEENWTFKVLPAEEFELQVTADKEALPGAKIYLYVDHNKGKGKDWDPKIFHAHASARSDSAGQARIKFVKDKIDIAVAAKGYASTTIRDVELSSEKPYLIELTKGRAITGRVTDSKNNPLKEVAITAKKKELFYYDEEFILKSSTDENGKFTLKNASSGQWEISARSEDPTKPYFIAPVTMKVRKWWPVRTIKMIAREGFRLKGRYVTDYKINIKDDGGLPWIEGFVSKPSRAWLQLRTKEDGTFDIWGFPCEGEGSIRFVGVGGYHNFIKMPKEYSYFKIFGARLNFKNVPPGTYENIEVHYLLEGKVSGTVVDADGKPWPGLEVVASPEGADKTDEQGKYSIWVPPGDNVWLKVQYPKRAPIFTTDMFSVKEGQAIEKNFVVKQKL